MELAKAYVQIIPSADGIRGRLSDTLSGESESAGSEAGKTAGGSLVSKLIAVVGAAKIGETIMKGISSAMSEGAEYEQLLGGVETLFGIGGKGLEEYAKSVGKTMDEAQAEYQELAKGQNIILRNADEAYKTAGLSANEYMKTVTSFSASLIKSLGGDTEKAAKAADQAIVDMADNANKMGTDMELIQNAYQGFAKQNYTMLDNLKLGYGGTKTEMQRLLADAQAFSGVKYDINNLSDVYSAIHVIQEEMDITGTTAKEASETFSGSLAAVKGALSNLVSYIAAGEEIGTAVTNLIETASTFFFGNMLPMLGNILSVIPNVLREAIETAVPYIQEKGIALVEALLTGYQEKMPEMYEKVGSFLLDMMNKITENLPALLKKGGELATNFVKGYREKLPEFISGIGNFITQAINFIGQNLPVFVSIGTDVLSNILNGIMESLPKISETLQEVIGNIVTAIGDNLPIILEAGVDILLNLLDGIIECLPELIKTAGKIVIDMVAAIAKCLPKVLESGIEIIGKLLAGIIKAVPELISSIPEIISDLGDAFMKKDWGQVGKDIIDGLINGIKGAATAVGNAIKEVAGNALKAAKEALGIHSPSRKFKWIGEMCVEGFDEPLENYSPYDTLKKSLKTNVSALQMSLDTGASGINRTAENINYRRMGDELARSLQESGFKLVVGKRELGRIMREAMV